MYNSGGKMRINKCIEIYKSRIEDSEMTEFDSRDSINHDFVLDFFQKNSYLGWNIDFINNNDNKSNYHTILIGKNGVGKSYILGRVAYLIREFNKAILHDSLGISLSKYDSWFYLDITLDEKRYAFSNLTIKSYYELINDEFVKKNISDDIGLEKDSLPNIIAVSSTVDDQFLFSNSTSDNYKYSYLGRRTTSNTAFTSFFNQRVIELISSASSQDFFVRFATALNTVGMSSSVGIEYKFERYNIIENVLEKFYPYLNDRVGGIKNKIMNKYGINNEILEIVELGKPLPNDRRIGLNTRDIKIYNLLHNKESIEQYCDLLNECMRLCSHNRNSFILEFDIYRMGTDWSYFTEIMHLSQKMLELSELMNSLSLLKKPDLEIMRNNSIEGRLSEGEQNYLTHLCILASIFGKNSVILFDEPESNLHPNWQMEFIEKVNTLLSVSNNKSHIIYATHSPLIVSDIPIESSSVIECTINKGIREYKIIDENPSYWSAENILYRIFGTMSNRNMYIAKEIENILKRIVDGDYISLENKEFLMEAKSNLKSNDPLLNLVNKIMENLEHE